MQIQEHIQLQPFNSFGVKATARYYSLIQDVATLQQIIHEAPVQSLPKLVLGGGSNILFTQDFDGWIIQMAIAGIDKLSDDATSVLLQVGAGCGWHKLVSYCIQQGYAGIENLSLIPGTVGAAPIQNIGAYGVEFSEVMEWLIAMEINTSLLRTFSKEDCAFGYRDSIFKNELQGQYIILSVVLRLQKQPTFRIDYGQIKETLAAMQVKELSIQVISQAVIHIRQSKLPDPAKLGNAGSFFKNPVIDTRYFEQLQAQYPILPYYSLEAGQAKLSAAWLIEQAGWKGYKQGQVGIHPAQALVIVNYGGATGKAIYQLAQRIQQSVQEKFGVSLAPEVHIL